MGTNGGLWPCSLIGTTPHWKSPKSTGGGLLMLVWWFSFCLLRHPWHALRPPDHHRLTGGGGERERRRRGSRAGRPAGPPSFPLVALPRAGARVVCAAAAHVMGLFLLRAKRQQEQPGCQVRKVIPSLFPSLLLPLAPLSTLTQCSPVVVYNNTFPVVSSVGGKCVYAHTGLSRRSGIPPK